MRQVQLQGEPPEVKILGEIIPDEPEFPMRGLGNQMPPRQMQPPPRPPFRGGNPHGTNGRSLFSSYFVFRH